MADLLECTHVTVSRYETFKRWPSIAMWRKMSAISDGTISSDAAVLQQKEAAE